MVATPAAGGVEQLAADTSAPVLSMMVRKWSALTADIRMVISGCAVGTSTSPLPYHLNRCSKPVSAGPEM
jgi:hypothetical protein